MFLELKLQTCENIYIQVIIRKPRALLCDLLYLRYYEKWQIFQGNNEADRLSTENFIFLFVCLLSDNTRELQPNKNYILYILILTQIISILKIVFVLISLWFLLRVVTKVYVSILYLVILDGDYFILTMVHRVFSLVCPIEF